MAENSHDLHNTPEPLPDLSKPENRHESRDVDAWAIGRFGIALVLLCIVALGLLFGFFQYLKSMTGGAPAPTAMAPPTPPAPALEVTPVIDLKAFHAANDQLLNTYCWVDQQKGIVRLPIDRAIDLLAQKGLPSRTQQPPSAGVSVPTESGLGPKMLPPGGPLAGGAQ